MPPPLPECTATAEPKASSAAGDGAFSRATCVHSNVNDDDDDDDDDDGDDAVVLVALAASVALVALEFACTLDDDDDVEEGAESFQAGTKTYAAPDNAAPSPKDRLFTHVYALDSRPLHRGKICVHYWVGEPCELTRRVNVLRE